MTVGDDDGASLGDGEWLIRDEAARTYVVGATRGVRSLVESTLGPRGMEKLVDTYDHQDEPETVVTADAGELIDAIERGDGFNHPVAALFVDSVDSIQRGLHDGGTTAVILASELVERGAALVERGVHPGSVVVGYAMASDRAGRVLDALARPLESDDRDALRRVAATSMTADLDPSLRRAYARVVADAVRGLRDASDDGWLDTDYVSVRTARGEPHRVYRGQIVRRRPGQHEASRANSLEFDWTPAVPRPVADATVAVLERGIDVEETATSLGGKRDSGVELRSASAVAEYASGRDAAIEAVADRLADLGVDVLVAQAELNGPVRSALSARGVAVVDRVHYPKSDIYRVARATGAQVVAHVDDLAPSKLGRAGRVRERRVGDEKWAYFEDCRGGVFTIVVDAGTATGLRKRERLVSDALEVAAVAAMDEQVLPGAGAPALAVARDVRHFAPSVAGREQLAVEAFADALEAVPSALARNAGSDPLDSLADLRTAHDGAGTSPAPIGFDAETGEPVDAWAAGIVEPRRIFSQAVETAVAAAERLLTIDAVVYPGVDLGAFSPRTEHD
ncbi:TCP-1/cpn60 chaperonin family protein [Halegenticoccus soli]|uniref:TCP-1/cpn60 chaperonin family protein n=1 Tax=Halegenticoccus soli TaxID=1985678 RepID=UPI000C6EAA6A|nr:TCP-1/cpn60 chaperonin family protein [Halegenticoccus soli]